MLDGQTLHSTLYSMLSAPIAALEWPAAAVFLVSRMPFERIIALPPLAEILFSLCFYLGFGSAWGWLSNRWSISSYWLRGVAVIGSLYLFLSGALGGNLFFYSSGMRVWGPLAAVVLGVALGVVFRLMHTDRWIRMPYWKKGWILFGAPFTGLGTFIVAGMFIHPSFLSGIERMLFSLPMLPFGAAALGLGMRGSPASILETIVTIATAWLIASAVYSAIGMGLGWLYGQLGALGRKVLIIIVPVLAVGSLFITVIR